eukprot:TRINITY_DN46204_c0_g1_i1.p1 TRINITY_DN46204_c0_g1~~TRINITY_DN46204_c0_g1_i1.p1  ORF type:complete len:201 (-),score=22.35 TRINITY_DN46204_c0_g1_i1:52-594(-)
MASDSDEFFDGVSLKEPALAGCGFFSCLFGPSFLINYFLQKEPLKLSSGPDMKPVMFPLCAYFFVFYVLMARQGMGKNMVNKDVIKAHGDKDHVKKWISAVDRCFLNTQEQSSAFLGSLLPYCMFVNPWIGAILCWVYTIFVVMYPCVYGKMPHIFASTVPRYFIITFMLAGCVVAAIRT